jgi:hypothetical protein
LYTVQAGVTVAVESIEPVGEVMLVTPTSAVVVVGRRKLT